MNCFYFFSGFVMIDYHHSMLACPAVFSHKGVFYPSQVLFKRVSVYGPAVWLCDCTGLAGMKIIFLLAAGIALCFAFVLCIC